MIGLPKKQSVIPDDLMEASGIVPVKKKKPDTKEKGIFFRTDEAVVRQLRVLSAEVGKDQKVLMAEAMNLLFARYGKGQIA